MPRATEAVWGHEEDSARRETGTLFESEKWWRDHYYEIQSHGYELRTRYRPDWEPSWKKSGKAFFLAEDGQVNLVSRCLLMLYILTLALVVEYHGRYASTG
jgi:hypothetical protein